MLPYLILELRLLEQILLQPPLALLQLLLLLYALLLLLEQQGAPLHQVHWVRLHLVQRHPDNRQVKVFNNVTVTTCPVAANRWAYKPGKVKNDLC